MDVRTTIFLYCDYQERSHQEVRDKLYGLGCHKEEVEQYISELIEKGLLNEERYARSIARGKFRIKHWGRVKIIQLLKQNRVSDYCIKKALTEIDYDEYLATLKKLAERKWNEWKTEKKEPIRKAKVFRYLLQKGYESTLVHEALNEIIRSCDE